VLKRWLIHENVLVRAISLWLLCFALLTVAWFVSYYFLPIGILRGVFPSANLPLGNTFFSVFLTIVLFNLIVACGFTIVANLLSVKSFPLGYFYPLIQIILYGIFLGTDSFGISHGNRLFPSLTVFNGAGPYELTTYILIAAATAKISVYNQTGWMGGSFLRNRKLSEIKLSHSETFAIALGILLLFIAAIIEALGILQVT
jgi:hypothetical protein